MRSRLAVLLVGCLGLAFPGTGSAHEYVSPTETTIKYAEAKGRFHGRVDSVRSACEEDRKVKLRKRTRSGWKFVGRTRTNQRGRWSIDKANANGVFSAVVPRRVNNPPGHIHDCERGTSGTVTVDP